MIKCTVLVDIQIQTAIKLTGLCRKEMTGWPDCADNKVFHLGCADEASLSHLDCVDEADLDRLDFADKAVINGLGCADEADLDGLGCTDLEAGVDGSRFVDAAGLDGLHCADEQAGQPGLFRRGRRGLPWWCLRCRPEHPG